MATVHCPECHRALNLPENQEVEVVCCPLCRHTFTPPAVPRIIQASIPVPTERIAPSFPGDPIPSSGDLPPLRSHSPTEDEDYVPWQQRSERESPLQVAATWMNTAAWSGLVGFLPCCGTTGLEIWAGSEPTGFTLFLCCMIGSYFGIMAGARAMRQQTSYRWAVTGVVLTILTTSVLILMSLPIILRMFDLWTGPIPFRNDGCCGVLLVFPSLLVIVCGLIGGIKGLLVLLHPGTRELFDPPPE